MDITNFILAGHSFGGYICGTYASVYPQHIKKLLMLSPLGVVVKPSENAFTTNRYRNGRKPPAFVRCLA
jgi:pimeloyl-ACP methyl ester carboxylesterase